MSNGPVLRRTWAGPRGLFALLALLFAGVVAWLVLHEGLLTRPFALLILVPASFCVGLLLLAFFASDALLKRVSKIFLSFS